jgi:hypothetical protein
VASTDTGILASTTPEQARSVWPGRLAAGLALLALAVVGLLWSDAGARLLLGAAGVAALIRGVLVFRAVAAGAVDDRARPLGVLSVGLGAVAVVVAVLSESLSGRVLVVAVPVLLFLTAGALVAQGGAVRRGGQVLFGWSAVVTALVVGAGVTGGWNRAAEVATVMAAIALAGLGVAAIGSALVLRGVAARPSTAAYPAPAGCSGCACGAGGCGAVSG